MVIWQQAVCGYGVIWLLDKLAKEVSFHRQEQWLRRPNFVVKAKGEMQVNSWDKRTGV